MESRGDLVRILTGAVNGSILYSVLIYLVDCTLSVTVFLQGLLVGIATALIISNIIRIYAHVMGALPTRQSK